MNDPSVRVVADPVRGVRDREVDDRTMGTNVNYPEHDPALPVVLVDFDGVLAGNTWPLPCIGPVDYEAIRMIQHYVAQGCEVTIFTARPESHHRRIWQWLYNQQIDHLIYDVTNVKKQASVYFDDRAVRWPLEV